MGTASKNYEHALKSVKYGVKYYCCFLLIHRRVVKLDHTDIFFGTSKDHPPQKKKQQL